MDPRGRGRTSYPSSARPTERREVINVTEMEAIPEDREDSVKTMDGREIMQESPIEA